jgi:tetratricopeptide (TPR) repeat protein
LLKALKAKKLELWQESIHETDKAFSVFYTLDHSATPIHWYKGSAYLNMGQIDSALVNFAIAEEHNPYHVQLLNDMGVCYAQRLEHAKAISYFERAFDIHPYLARKNLVAAYFNAGYADKALRLSVDPRFGKPVFLKELLKAGLKRP